MGGATEQGNNEIGVGEIWQVATSRLLVTFRGQSQGISSLAWSPDCRDVATGSGDQTVQVWSATSGQRLVTWHGDFEGVQPVSWSSDGSYIASGGWDAVVEIWHLVLAQS